MQCKWRTVANCNSTHSNNSKIDNSVKYDWKFHYPGIKHHAGWKCGVALICVELYLELKGLKWSNKLTQFYVTHKGLWSCYRPGCADMSAASWKQIIASDQERFTTLPNHNPDMTAIKAFELLLKPLAYSTTISRYYYHSYTWIISCMSTQYTWYFRQ